MFRFNRLIAFVLIFATAISPALHTVSHADDVVTLPETTIPVDETDVGAAISPMKKGQRAPFTGLLLSPLAVATMKVQLDSINEQIRIEVKRSSDELTAQYEKKLSDQDARHVSDKTIAEAKQAYSDYMTKQLDKRLQEEIDSRPNVLLLVSLGAVGGAAVTVLTFYIASQLSK